MMMAAAKGFLMRTARRLINKMFPKLEFEKKLNIKVATSTLMDNAIELWLDMYQGNPPWLDDDGADVKSLNLPSAIAEEIARLVLTEFDFGLSGSARASFIQDAMSHFLARLPTTVELWCAAGGIVVKPYAKIWGGGRQGQIGIDIIPANRFYPTAFDSNGCISGGVFVETKREGGYLYTRLECHLLKDGQYSVSNKAFRSERINTAYTEDDTVLNASYPLLEEVPLGDIDGWGDIAPDVTMENVMRPFFVYVRNPRANTIDPNSPLGASVFSRAVGVIEEADRQYSRILWEFDATEAAIDADISLFDMDKHGNPVLPKGRERLFRKYDFEGSGKEGFIKEFAPEIRDASLFNGLNEYLRKIEFLCGLAYGTLSDVSDVERTATEIKMSKQRSYTTVSKMQQTWDNALGEIVDVMGMLCDLYGIVPPGLVERTCSWGDGVLDDTDMEYQRRWAMVMSGKMKVEKFYAWYFGCSEDEALDYIPDTPSYPPPE